MLETLDDVRADIASRLARAAKDRKSAMHTPVVATGDADARVMVLRAFDAAAWTLRFHTDARAPKVSVVKDDPRIGLLFYDKAQKVQLRLRGRGRIVRDGDMVDAAWEASTNFARRCYLGEGPGASSDTPTSGIPEAFEGTEPEDAELVPARPNFALLMVELQSLDWFHLAHTGHRRAQFDRAQTGHGSGSWEGRWVSP
ncbi:pyridoxamine 5'-phosphate oxidase family protein [Qipengyuania sp. DSG2-2]|uniref:pyridoxamine 5'-phosphate oxidase family protein n=1 Tax=Qipengyuania sp. DGS2-2 TaxID=3349631 RepID=UPI0036D37AB1